MSFTLYGSHPSPYVRRIRLLLDAVDYTFEAVDIYNDAGRSEYAKLSPLRKLPVLVDGDQTVFDSHIIHQYLCDKLDLPRCSLEQHNLISAVDAVTDSLIVLLMGQRSELEVDDSKFIFKLQLERIPNALDWLNERATAGAFDEWHYPAMALISLIGWIEFRELWDLSPYTSLLSVRDQFATRDIVLATAPQ